jgi:hypothetical protein
MSCKLRKLTTRVNYLATFLKGLIMQILLLTELQV